MFVPSLVSEPAKACSQAVNAGLPFSRPRASVVPRKPIRRRGPALSAARAPPAATDGRAAEQGDEIAPPHSIASSANANSFGGKSRPSVLAVLRLMTSSNFVGCTTGKSAGFAPLRTRPT